MMVKKYSLYLAWAIAFFGSLISIYFGEILRFQPCTLCWYQRISLFPLAIILAIAAYKDDRNIVPYSLPLSCIGLFFALYQSVEPYIPALQETPLCRDQGCLETVFNLFGFLSFPILSLIGFLLITLFLILAKKPPTKSS